MISGVQDVYSLFYHSHGSHFRIHTSYAQCTTNNLWCQNSTWARMLLDNMPKSLSMVTWHGTAQNDSHGLRHRQRNLKISDEQLPVAPIPRKVSSKHRCISKACPTISLWMVVGHRHIDYNTILDGSGDTHDQRQIEGNNGPQTISWDDTGIITDWPAEVLCQPIAYFCVQLRAVDSYFGRSVLYMWAISGTRGSSGLGSVSREQMESKTWNIQQSNTLISNNQS